MKKIFIYFIIIALLLAAAFILFFKPHEPDLSIEGTKYHEVYNKPVKFKIDNKDNGSDYTFLIDGKIYNEGSIFKEEGRHQLKVQVKKFGRTLSKTVDFTIDTKKPEDPELTGVESDGVYFKKTAIHLDKKSGTVYLTYLNGKPYTLNTPITDEGDYTFKVISIKETNGLSTEKTIDFSIDNRLYTKEEVSYFTKIALGTEFNPTSKLVKKWYKPIVIKPHLKATKADLQMIKKAADELSELTKLDISMIDSEDGRPANINIYFPSRKDFRMYEGDSYNGNTGYFSYSDSANEIVSAYILIDSEVDQGDRNQIILEELTQALGMGNDAYDYKDSVFQQAKTQLVLKFSEIDNKVIELLYREDIKPGMTEKDVWKGLKPRIKG